MNDQLQKYEDQDDIYIVHSKCMKQLNSALAKGFFENYERDDVERTHLFNGRLENTYLNENHIPELAVLREEACKYANQILGTDDIEVGFWFNHMPPGAVTTSHRHDDDDELLSSAYYISVPENSGDFIIKTSNIPGEGETLRITPVAGSFLLFKPNMLHEVTENLSNEHRFSIGMNFGRREYEEY
ncbi:MAG: hypothetical protein KAJ92_00620 [Gammaproteobacteria bacterium]|nr:hypothetical protein [Gammaproteobacteria bacterium]